MFYCRPIFALTHFLLLQFLRHLLSSRVAPRQVNLISYFLGISICSHNSLLPQLLLIRLINLPGYTIQV